MVFDLEIKAPQQPSGDPTSTGKVHGGFDSMNCPRILHVASIEESVFMKHPMQAKDRCAMSQALTAIEIRLEANLIS
jgi:hypothetical protein